MKLSTLIVLLLIISSSLTSFGQGKISGKIVTDDEKPIPSVNVLLMNLADSSLVKGSVTNQLGEYHLININSGKYFIRFSEIGYLTFDSPSFELTGGDKNLGKQALIKNARQLNEVVIKSEKPLYQQRADGIVVNVENSILTKGSSALQVLERAPGIYIDRQNNDIALNGKGGVTVMVNGKLMRLPISQVVSLLNGMSANNIEKIELLTTPPAKYDAEGNAGMINIVLKKNLKTGTNGSYSLTGGYGRYEKGSASVDLTHNTDFINLYGSYSFSHDKSYSNWFARGTQDVPLLGGDMNFDFWNVTTPVQNNHNATVGIDVKVNPKTTIGSNISYYNLGTVSRISNIGDYTIKPDSFLFLNAALNSRSRWENVLSNVYLEHNIKEGQKINFDIDYLRYKNSSPTEVNTSFLNKENKEAALDGAIFAPLQRGLANTTIKVGIVKIDYANQLSSKIKFETGIKGTYTKSSSFSAIESLVGNTWVNSLAPPNNISMKEGIGAAYASFNIKLNPSAEFVLGARYEYSDTRLDEAGEQDKVHRKLGKFFPNVLFLKKLNSESELQFSYSKRISRPSYNDLASFITYNDPISIFTGNAQLKPVITNNVKAGYKYKSYSFSLLFSRDNNPIARNQVTPSPAGDLIYIAPQNVKYQNNLTLETNLPFKIMDWWDMNYGFAGGYRQFKLEHTIDKIEKTYFGYNVYSSQTFKLPNSYSLEVSGFYNSLSYNGSIKTDGFGMLNMGIKKELKNNMGSIQLSVSDVLMTMNINTYFGSLTPEAFALKSKLSYNTESRTFPIVKVTYYKSFGNSKSTVQRKSDSGSKDERDRIRNY